MAAAPPRLQETVTGIVAERLAAGEPVVLDVAGGSMAPCIFAGDLVTVVPLHGRHLRTGDVVACRGEGYRVVVHRLVGKKRLHGRRVLLTKGDACVLVDRPVGLDQVLGRVVSVRRRGRRVAAHLSGRHAQRRAALSRLESWLSERPIVRVLPKLVRSSGRRAIRRVGGLARAC